MVKNTAMLDLPCWSDSYGSLVAIEESDTIPFPVTRVYYIFDVGDGIRRGFHSHKDLDQALICVNGSVRIFIEDDEGSEVVLLDDPKKALHIGPMVWREMFDFSDQAVLLVLASRHYDTSDYERDHDAFLKKAKLYFEGEGE
ncbi:sugar 3,4-ketoisomerase [Eggerthella timonensis]|uniref:sugar 3,4-ketoisomerase n=1 Tax=Eggerthella timonensis TaxID=1871008 RepID=UPI000C7673A9|nr:FdtA/QdtA family cupin domain-containing protein [Eggerthella timonensis]